jgi:hypothetical protein
MFVLPPVLEIAPAQAGKRECEEVEKKKGADSGYTSAASEELV